MEEKRKKFLPQESKNNFPAATVKSSKSAFQARKIAENNHSTPAGNCISIRDQFDNYIKALYPNTNEEQQKAAWGVISNQLLTQSGSKLEDLILDYFK